MQTIFLVVIALVSIGTAVYIGVDNQEVAGKEWMMYILGICTGVAVVAAVGHYMINKYLDD